MATDVWEVGAYRSETWLDIHANLTLRTLAECVGVGAESLKMMRLMATTPLMASRVKIKEPIRTAPVSARVGAALLKQRLYMQVGALSTPRQF